MSVLESESFGEHFEMKLNLDFGAISKDVDEKKQINLDSLEKI